MQKIIPHIWYDTEAKEAADFYVSVFGGNSKIKSVTVIPNTPSGDCDFVEFSLWGYELMAISAGPYFKPNPSISLMINFDPSQDKDARERIDEVWGKLSEGGKALMPLSTYPFSERYGWVEDKYGFSWQLIYTNPHGEERPLVIPSLLFVTDAGKTAEDATNFYLSVFRNTKRGAIARYPADMAPNTEGAVMFTDFVLESQWFAAMDGSSAMHHFSFNEGVSFVINCESQKEIDYFSEKLSAVPEAEQCGWIKDKYGVSWQITPDILGDMLKDKDRKKVERVTQALLAMKKLDIAALKKAYERN